MTLIKYRDHRFNTKAAKVVEQANQIISEFQADGYVLTLRQLYYQFVSRNWIANTEKEYKRLGRIVTDARESGVISWTAIEDAGRNVFHNIGAESQEEALRGIEEALKLNPWLTQDHYLEVWVEKQALEAVIARPANRRRVAYMACKGYLSASESWRAGLRFEEAIRRGQQPVLLHLGDHDPSGIDMTRDNGERLELFARQGVDVRRLALNMDQIEQYNPPPNPAKMSDSRAEGYVAQHGETSWELDALPPREIDRIIAEAIEEYVNEEKWQETMAREAELRKPLAMLADRWPEVKALLDRDDDPMDRLGRLEQAIDTRFGCDIEEAADVAVQYDEHNRGYLADRLRRKSAELWDILKPKE